MARPVVIETETLLSATRAVFLDRGIHATTADIAKQAGVSEATLFKRFVSKERLLKAACQQALTSLLAIPESAPETPLSPAVLAELGVRTVNVMRGLIPITIAAHMTPLDLREKFGADPPPLRVSRAFGLFFRERARRGELECPDPSVLGSIFVGTIWHRSFISVLSDRPSDFDMGDDFLRAFTALLWRGIAPKAKPAKGHGKARSPRASRRAS